MLDIVSPPGERRGCRQRHGDQSRILAGEESAHKVGTRFGNERYPLARSQACTKHPPCQRFSLVPEVPVGQYTQELAAGGVKVETGTTLCRVLERFLQCREIRQTESATASVRRSQL